MYLAVSSPPANLSAVRLFWSPAVPNPGDPQFPWLEIYATNLVNGIAALPQDEVDRYPFAPSWGQCVAANGDFGGQFQQVGLVAEEQYSPGWNQWGFRFVDTRSHLKENLKFLLRSATVGQAFGYRSRLGINGVTYGVGGTDPEFWFGRPTGDSDYEYSGFRVFSTQLNYSLLQQWRPVQENYLWRNFAPVDGDPPTGGGYDNIEEIRTLNSPYYRYTGSLANAAPTPVLTNGSTSAYYYRWTPDPESEPGAYEQVGLQTNSSGDVFLPNGVRNVYGLPLLAVKGADVEVPAGASAFWFWEEVDPWYVQTQPPALQTVGYYFNSQTPYFRYGPARLPLPGTPDFSVTNATPVLIAPFGQLYTVAGWAKQAITNGYAGKFGYLEQYFDQAYTVDTNGVATTNVTGLLSPYGEFFPTEPGPAALVTLPDLETGERGTCMVQVIKLQLDVNHDGVMDLSFGGPDNTSANRPFVFWVNNDRDYSGNSADYGHEVKLEGTNAVLFYGDGYGQGIGSHRDMEDLARLWICGMPALATNAGYQVTLSWNVSSGSPAINLFRAAETNGGIGYLTNLAIATAQLSGNNNYVLGGPGWKIGTISASQSFTFPGTYFTNSGDKYFLFEGAGVGSGELVMTISQGTNVLARTSSWFDLKDIKTMFEQAHINHPPVSPPNSALSDQSTFQEDFTLSADSGEAKQMIVFVHGWRMELWDYYSFSSTMFKRLYWAGYQGRFASLRWPCLSKGTDGTIGQWLTFNRSEYISFMSAKAAEEYLRALQARLPGYSINVAAHSQGNILMMETLKRFLTNGSPVIDNYVLMEAAVPAHCYDTNAPNYSTLVDTDAESPTPDTYRGYPGAINNGLRTGGQMVNFFNRLDFAVQLAWESNEILNKPDFMKDYEYTPQNGAFRESRAITDPRELMAFVARPRSRGVGTQIGVQGVIQGGEANLEVEYGFTHDSGDHSGQYNRPIQQVHPFYERMLRSFNF
jgi:pimeloyl-ACP methyl ester carboxylesterase